MSALKVILVCCLPGSLFLTVGNAAGKNADGSVKVDGYTKKDGTYVAPHNQTAPNKTKNDNWSTKGNVNPYTGKEGTKPGGDNKRPAVKPTVAHPVEPVQRSHAELELTVRRCNQLLDSYVHAPYGKSPFNAARYEEIRLERDAALGELNNGH